MKVLPFLLLTLVFFLYPQEVLTSASSGLSLWVNYVLPALFPFFVISDLLLRTGFIHFLGVLLEPLMRPVFRLPGKASFIVAMTHTSGIPTGAILTCKMRKSGEISKTEGERLLAFTCNPSPGFMFGAVASGMLGNPALGIIIAGSIYIPNLIIGILFRFYGKTTTFTKKNDFSIHRAWWEMELTQKNNKKPLGDQMADAVRDSISTTLLVGGFIVIFSVITHMLNVIHITAGLADGISVITGGWLTPLAGNALIQGLLETTLGCKAAIPALSSLNSQIGMLAFILGWGGLSVFAQVAAFTSSTDLSFRPFFLGRILHSVLALITSQILLRFTGIQTMVIPSLTGSSFSWLNTLRLSTFYLFVTIMFMIACALLLHIILKLRRAGN